MIYESHVLLTLFLVSVWAVKSKTETHQTKRIFEVIKVQKKVPG